MEDVLCLDVALLVDDRVDDHTRLGLVGGDDVLDLVNIVMISIVHIIIITILFSPTFHYSDDQ